VLILKITRNTLVDYKGKMHNF